MKWLTLRDGSKWPDPIEASDAFNPAAKAYHNLIMNPNLTLQNVRDKIGMIRKAVGRPHVIPEHLKRVHKYNGKLYTIKELEVIAVEGVTGKLIKWRRRQGKSWEEALFTPKRKYGKRANVSSRVVKYGGYDSAADQEALGDCNEEQLKILGVDNDPPKRRNYKPNRRTFKI